MNTNCSTFRVYRGGGFCDFAGSCRSAFRGRGVPSSRDYDLGFRPVLRKSTRAYRVRRGGSFISLAGLCRSAIRYRSGPTRRSFILGFRPVLREI
jgi:formylglycine-generating enzyme required for sulfatase activity